MSFLSPLFLLGALAVAGPVIFHLIRRTTRERTVFSSLLFLSPTPPRLTRKSRLEHLLLLLLRCLALLLLALGFARPFLKQALPPTPEANALHRTLLLVDTSASQRRTGLWEATRERVRRHLRDAAPGDQVAVFTFDRELTSRFSFAQWEAASADQRLSLAEAGLDGVQPTWESTRLGPALVRAAEELTDTEGGEAIGRRIILISDFQEGARLDPLQSYEWPKGVELIPDPVRAATPGNAGLQRIAEAPDADRGTEPVVRVRVANSPDAKREQFQVGWAKPDGTGFVGAPQDVYVPPGQGRMVTLATPTNVTGLNRVLLRGDDEPFDNTVYVLPPVPVQLDVLYLGQDVATDSREPLAFLRRALPETRRQTVRLTARKSGETVPPDLLARTRLAVVTSPVSEATREQLKARLAEGLTVVFAPASAEAGAGLGQWVDLPDLRLTEVRPPTYAMLAELDFRHPLLAPFADPRFSDFTKIHFWRYRRLDGALPDTARVAARFDSGAPAWVDFPRGRGRVIWLASGWSVADSQFALSSKFVPWLYGLLDVTGLGAPPALNPSVGDPLPLPPGRTGELAIRRPDGTQTNLPASATQFAGTELPGVYLLGTGATAVPVAVNVDPAELRTAPLPPEELERLGVRLDAAHTAAASEKQPPTTVPPAAEAEGRQKFWRWLLVATLALLIFESFLAGRTARQNPLPQEALS